MALLRTLVRKLLRSVRFSFFFSFRLANLAINGDVGAAALQTRAADHALAVLAVLLAQRREQTANEPWRARRAAKARSAKSKKAAATGAEQCAPPADVHCEENVLDIEPCSAQ